MRWSSNFAERLTRQSGSNALNSHLAQRGPSPLPSIAWAPMGAAKASGGASSLRNQLCKTMWMDAGAVDYRSQFLFILVEQSHRHDTPILAHFGREPCWRAHYVPCALHVEELCHLCFVESTSVCIRGETLEPHQIITVLPGTVVDFDSKPVNPGLSCGQNQFLADLVSLHFCRPAFLPFCSSEFPRG